MHDVTATATYNGWSNRETWLASLWLTNDQESYALLRSVYQRYSSRFEQAEQLECVLRDQLSDEIGDASLWCDLLTTAFDRINWLEVIENNQ